METNACKSENRFSCAMRLNDAMVGNGARRVISIPASGTVGAVVIENTAHNVKWSMRLNEGINRDKSIHIKTSKYRLISANVRILSLKCFDD